MGNCFKQNTDSLSSLSYQSRSQKLIQNDQEDEHFKKRPKSRLLSQVQTIIIKEDPDSEIEPYTSMEIDSNFLIEHQEAKQFDTAIQGIKIEPHHYIKLQNLHTQRNLHSHFIKHEHNKMNEVSTCNNCNFEYDWWQIQILNNKTYIYHPITNTYLCSSNHNSHFLCEVGCLSQEMDEWQIIADDKQLKQNSIIKLKHKNTRLYLHTQPFQSKIEDQHIVSLCKIDKANQYWRICDVQ